MLGSKLVKFLMSILRRQVNSSSNFASFLIVMTHNSSIKLKLRHFLLWMKRCHWSPNFEVFQNSRENVLNSSCHFPNRKSVFLQILHHSTVSLTVSWKITPVYFFRSSIIYFVQKESFEVHLFEASECWVKIRQIPCK